MTLTRCFALVLSVAIGAVACRGTVVYPFARSTPENPTARHGAHALIMRALRELGSELHEQSFSVVENDAVVEREELSCRGESGRVQCGSRILPILVYAAAASMKGERIDVGLGYGAELTLPDEDASWEEAALTATDSSPMIEIGAAAPERGEGLELATRTIAGRASVLGHQEKPFCVGPFQNSNDLAPNELSKAVLEASDTGTPNSDQRVLLASTRYLLAFIIGHELTHADGGCRIAATDHATESFASVLPSLQRRHAPCATALNLDVLNKFELQADRCAARSIVRLRASARRFGLAPQEDVRARTIALRVIAHALARGMASHFQIRASDGAAGASRAAQATFEMKSAVGLCERDCWSARPLDITSAPSEWCKQTCDTLRSAMPDSTPALSSENSPNCDTPALPGYELLHYAECRNTQTDPKSGIAKSLCIACGAGLPSVFGFDCSHCQTFLNRVRKTTRGFGTVAACRTSPPELVAKEPSRRLPPQGYPFPLLRIELLRFAFGLHRDTFADETRRFLGRYLCQTAASCAAPHGQTAGCSTGRELGEHDELAYERWTEALDGR